MFAAKSLNVVIFSFLDSQLYIGGLPSAMFSRSDVAAMLDSRKGFRGCLASVDLSSSVPDLMNYAVDRSKVLNGCTGEQHVLLG